MLLWWWMLGAAVIVFTGAVVMLVIAYVRRGTAGLPIVGEREGVAEGMVLVFGLAIPVVVLVALFGVANVYLIRQTSPPAPSSTAMTIDVIGHQWWWEVRYPGTGAVTANEIHIPVDTRVNVVATTADVIHSFWVPALNRKIDMIPGRRNRILLYASTPGRLPRAVLAVLRSAARAHGAVRVRAATGAVPSVAGQHGVRREGPDDCRGTGRRAAVHGQPVRELPPDSGQHRRRATSALT